MCVGGGCFVKKGGLFDLSLICDWQTWRRPTFPRLETKYHRRWGVSRPSSEWDRVRPPRCNHQVGQSQKARKLREGVCPALMVSGQLVFVE